VKGFVKFMSRIFVIFLTTSFFVGCKSAPPKPAGLLSKDEMVQVLANVYISEEKVTRLNLANDSATLVAAVMRSKALQQSGVSDSTFVKSFDYYMDHPTQLEEIYSVLVDTLQLREQRATQRAY
jgi:hypothetical protein